MTQISPIKHLQCSLECPTQTVSQAFLHPDSRDQNHVQDFQWKKEVTDLHITAVYKL